MTITNSISVFIICLVACLIDYISCGAIQSGNVNGLYDAVKDDVEILNKTTFDSIYKSDRAVFVEFYAHWCGACQRYAQHWKEIAKETKSWHNKVIRVAAINCADQENDPLCREFNIEYYPTLKLFTAQAVKGVQPTSFRSDNTEALITKMILFIENHEHKPVTWPELEPYTSKRLDTMFMAPYHNCKFAFLIFEKSDVDELGRKLILDFSAYTDRIAIRRVVSNPTLVAKFDIDTKHLPVVYLINNTHASGMKAFERFDEKLIDKYTRNLGQLKVEEEDLKQDVRKRYSLMIRKFIKLTELVTNAELENLDKNMNAAQIHAEQVNRAEAQSYLTNMDNRIFMQDLESGLHLMLRSDVARSKLITGDKLKALKEWIRVLVQYFPARKPIRNYLKQIYSKLNNTNDLTSYQWKMITDEKQKNSFLPETVDWRHCKGSQIKFRGYPCSLWTLFHVLTVSQIDLEKAKPRPFEGGFNLNEVIEAIRLFVFNFFTCRECADNFRMETENYIRYLTKPYDAVQYLWTVHNSVNKRLAKDETADPVHPKIMFPSQQQCPKCYLANIKMENLADHESPWIINEVLLFLTSFYSKYQIEGIRELDANKSDEAIKFYDYEDEKNANNQPMKRQAKRLTAIDSFANSDSDSFNNFSKQNIRDMKITIFIVCIIFSVLVSLIVYFNFAKKRFKLKKHLI